MTTKVEPTRVEVSDAHAARLILMRQKVFAAQLNVQAVTAQFEAEMLRVAAGLPEARKGQLEPQADFNEERMTVTFVFKPATEEVST